MPSASQSPTTGRLVDVPNATVFTVPSGIASVNVAVAWSIDADVVAAVAVPVAGDRQARRRAEVLASRSCPVDRAAGTSTVAGSKTPTSSTTVAVPVADDRQRRPACRTRSASACPSGHAGRRSGSSAVARRRRTGRRRSSRRRSGCRWEGRSVTDCLVPSGISWRKAPRRGLRPKTPTSLTRSPFQSPATGTSTQLRDVSQVPYLKRVRVEHRVPVDLG